MFLAIAVDNLANAQELTAAEEAAAAEAALKVCTHFRYVTFIFFILTLMSYPAVHLNCTKSPLSHDACVSIYDGFFNWFAILDGLYKCPTGALVSLLLQRQFVFHLIFPCVLYYIKLITLH